MSKIFINVDKARKTAQDMRRAYRSEKLAPLDRIVALNIPGDDLDAAEQQRQAIRDKNAETQAALEAATSAEELSAILADMRKE